MKYLKRCCLMFVSMMFCAACGHYDTFPKERSKGLGEPAGLKALIDEGQTVETGDYRIVDVRPEGKYAKGHIPSATNLPNGKVDNGLPAPPKDKLIIVYCETGGRAEMAARKMKKEGYAQVYNWGGFDKWTDAPEM